MASMQFVPQSKKTEFVYGQAKVEVIGGPNTVDGKEVVETKIRICYLDTYDPKKTNPDGTPVISKVVNFSDGQKCKIYDMTELPVVIDAEIGTEMSLRVHSEGSKIIEFLPWNENDVEARFVEFFHVNGKDTPALPTPKDKWNKNDEYEADVLQFNALFKIEGGAFDGKVVSDYLQFSKKGISRKEPHRPYEFVTFPKTADGTVGLGFSVLPNGSTGDTQMNKIYDLRHCGLLDGESIVMPEDNNPLPLIEAKLQRANKLVKIDIAKGYVVSISSAKKATFQVAKKEEVAPKQTEITPALDEM